MVSCCPCRLARSVPWLKSMPSTTERMARSWAARLPRHWGALRVPDSTALASSVPRRRHPGGASKDQTPTGGSCTLRVPASAASAGQVQAPSRRFRRVLMSAWICPARSLSQRKLAPTWSPSVVSTRRASRTPARRVAAADASVCRSRSPPVRSSVARTRRVSMLLASHWPPNIRSPRRPRLAIWV